MGEVEMGVRENKVENHLKAEAKKEKWLTRKWVSPGHSGVTDQLLFIPLSKEQAHNLVDSGLLLTWTVPVEVKTVDGALSPLQEREIDRLLAAGLPCQVVYGESGVDALVSRLKGELA